MLKLFLILNCIDRAVRWDFKGESTFGKRNLNICMNELFKFCLMHTDFPIPRLSLKPQGMVDLKKMQLSFSGSIEGVQDFLIKAH